MKKHFHSNTNGHRSGFTLVELLVVISIIAMLAGLLLPAINAARESGRRIQCVSNQKQVAFALLNYESTKGTFPALRAPLKPSVYAWVASIPDDANPVDFTELTWVAFILPFMEQNMAWGLINSGTVGNNLVEAETLYNLVIPVMQCKSGGISPGESRISYVANAGPLNTILPTSPHYPAEFGHPDRLQRDAKMYTIFFDHQVSVGTWSDVIAAGITGRDNTRISVDNISSMDGTSNTILLSENEDAGHWIWYEANRIDIPITSGHMYPDNYVYDFRPFDDETGHTVEHSVGFCYPDVLSSIDTGEIPTYEPPTVGGLPNNVGSPLFINEGRNIFFNGQVSAQYPVRIELVRKTRPSSGHPGVVVAAFVDGGVRTLKDDMDKTLFVRLCRPGSGVIINPKDLGW